MPDKIIKVEEKSFWECPFLDKDYHLCMFPKEYIKCPDDNIKLPEKCPLRSGRIIVELSDNTQHFCPMCNGKLGDSIIEEKRHCKKCKTFIDMSIKELDEVK